MRKTIVGFGSIASFVAIVWLASGCTAEDERLSGARGESLVAEKRYCEALVCLDASLKTMPSARKYALRASAFNGLNQPEKAIADCERAIRLNPHEAKAFLERARAYLLLARYHEALDDVNWAIGLRPGDIAACRLRDQIEADKKRSAEEGAGGEHPATNQPSGPMADSTAERRSPD